MEWGYLLILLSSILTCAMTSLRKEYQQKADATLKSTLAFMGVSSLLVCCIGVGYGCFTDFSMLKQADSFVVGLSVLCACILTVNTILCIFGAKYGSSAMIITFATLGTLVISTIYGILSDPVKNTLTPFNIVGLALAILIIALSFLAGRKEKPSENTTDGKKSKIFIFVCLAIFLFNGSALSVYSIFTSNRASYGGFNFIFMYLFFCVLICFAVLGALYVLDKKKGKAFTIKHCVTGKPLLLSYAYGITFFFAEFCALTTTTILPIVIQAPLSFAIGVIIVAIVDYVIYKQKLTKIQLIQIGLALASAVLFSI